MRSIPIANKILSKKWHDKDHEIHEKKLKEMRSTVDINPPNKYSHL